MYFQRWPDRRDLTPFFACGRAMGFHRFELSHILSADVVERLVPGAVEIAAVHHPCPADADLGAVSDLTAPDPDIRARAVTTLRRTIDTAARLGAPLVVVHLGRIADHPDGQGRRLRFELESRFRAGQAGRSRYAAVRGALCDWRSAGEPAHLARAIDALPEALDHAARRGIRLGLETGNGAHELPTPEGMARLLDTFDRSVLGAWLDTGHVAVQRNLGLTSFEAWFESVGRRWVGVHAHDVVGLRDHLVPGAGELDFAAIAAGLARDLPITCEVDWYFEPDEVIAGAELLERAWRDGGRSGGG